MFRKILIMLCVLGLNGGMQAQASTWTADLAHSNIGFSVKHMMISNVRGTFTQYDVTLNYDEQDLTKSSVKVSIAAASINTDNEQRDNHLKSPDFFDVEKFPTLTFVSKSLMKTESGLKVIGDLTIHGVTQEIVLNVSDLTQPVVDPWGMTRLGASATAKINRADFGLVWNKVLETGGVVVGNEVTINVEVELVKK